MRLWSIHPNNLDYQGLGGAWREGLMAQSVIRKLLNGQKPGYRNHPQLRRFLATPDPLVAIGAWLSGIQDEATRRGYRYNRLLILRPGQHARMTVTCGQLQYEFDHLMAKLKERLPGKHDLKLDLLPHPIFDVIEGNTEDWEKVNIRDEK